eukprot:CAMPEP_0171080420 /NCGR_PEP_ID=MMETSP0766_2-20121228/15860_1 /TAXON_ID=439317 /ORGANISM="Gambierdiscus australes, Strain CAWD 149" /LENGTH=267 /DNA_ID=CAMNT_0011537661 /DNA_START=46 /DNA_END=846 /DNA_ORIENTATION=+
MLTRQCLLAVAAFCESHSSIPVKGFDESIWKLWLSKIEPAWGRSTALARNVTEMKRLAWQLGLSPKFFAPRLPELYDFSRWIVKHRLVSPRTLLKFSEHDAEEGLLSPNRTLNYIHGYCTWGAVVPCPGDLHEPLPFTDVDLVLLIETMEHLHTPLLALQHIRETLAYGGHIFMTAPANIVAHMTPFHFSQFTLMGLGVLVLQADMEVVEAGQWGSKEYKSLMSRDLSERIRFHQGKLEGRWPGWGSLRNLVGDIGHVDHVWMLARK